MSTVFVTNKSSKTFKDRHHGKDYSFDVGQTVEIPLAAAQHIFGFQDSNKEPYLARLGFIRFHSELEEALQKLARFEITSELPQQDRSLPSAVGVVPLRVERHARGKSIPRAA